MVGEGSREKERLAESRVYSRKSVKGPKTNRNNNLGQPRARTIASDDADLSQQQLLTRFEADSSSLNYSQGFLMQENRVSISLSSRSKQEMQRLRRKLESELDLVRNWVKKIEGKDGQGPLENGKGQGSGELGHGLGLEKFTDRFIKSCSALLEKLMKHKHGWVFNEPVDPKALGLHDYLDVIKNPMDLGTVKTRLNTNWYKSPREFAEDVRLTFRNAMTYNPKGDDVHAMAEQLSKIFEDKWVVIEADYMRELRISVNYEVGLPTPTSRKLSSLASPAIETRKVSDRSESMVSVCDPKSKPMNLAHLGRTPAPKKPKAKDPVKRDMTYDEKQKLSMNLQNLPSEKLGNVVQIIKKRNSSLCQKDDEIEVDIDSVDTETLWELDRFVTNYRKSLSKNKRKAELAIQARAEEASYTQNPPSSVVEAPKETGTDEKNFSSSSPGQVEKQGDNASRSSSSGSESGSSRDLAGFNDDNIL